MKSGAIIRTMGTNLDKYLNEDDVMEYMREYQIMLLLADRDLEAKIVSNIIEGLKGFK